ERPRGAPHRVQRGRAPAAPRARAVGGGARAGAGACGGHLVLGIGSPALRTAPGRLKPLQRKHQVGLRRLPSSPREPAHPEPEPAQAGFVPPLQRIDSPAAPGRCPARSAGARVSRSPGPDPGPYPCRGRATRIPVERRIAATYSGSVVRVISTTPP